MKEYSLFLPPNHLAIKGRENWTDKEANEYKDWLLINIDSRIKFLMDYVNENISGFSSIDLLNRVGFKVVELLKSNDFSDKTQSSRQLNNKGYALAADMGLLLAKLLINDYMNKLTWKIIKKPKSEMAYNLPVLDISGFNYFEPIGGSIAEVNGIFRGKRNFEAWAKVYLFWSDKVTDRKSGDIFGTSLEQRVNRNNPPVFP